MRKSELKKLANQYAYLVEWSDEDEAYLAHCIELGVTAHGGTQEEALGEAKEAALAGLEILKKAEIPEPLSLQNFSGKLNLRMTPQKHREIAIQAKSQGVSINHYIVSRL